MLNTTNSATHYRRRVAEIHEIAKGIYDRKERGLLRDIAKEFEQFAREREEN